MKNILVMIAALALLGACNQPPVYTAPPAVIEPPVSTVPEVVEPKKVEPVPDPVPVAAPPSMSTRTKPVATTPGSIKK